MSAVVEASFFHPKNVGCFNSKLGQAADMNQTVDCGLICIQSSYGWGWKILRNKLGFLGGAHTSMSLFLSACLSVGHHISGTVYYVIIIFGTHL